MNCQNCGQPLEPGAAFCANCGQPVQATTPQAGPVVFTTPQQVGTMPATQPQVVMSPQSSPQVSQYNVQPQYGAPQPGFNGNVVGMGGTQAAAMPVGVKDPAEHSAELKGIIGVILGVIGFAGVIIPLIGIVFGIAGVVLGTISRSKYKHLVSLLAIFFSSVAILIGLGSWVYVIEHDPRINGTTSSTTTGTTSGGLMAMSTPCYSVKIDTGLNNYTTNGCNFDSSSQSEEFTVDGADDPNVNSSNLPQVGQAAIAKGASGTNGTVTKEGMGQFDRDPAYLGYITNNVSGIKENILLAVVFHETSSGENFFVIGKGTVGNVTPSFGVLESTWQWK